MDKSRFKNPAVDLCKRYCRHALLEGARKYSRGGTKTSNRRRRFFSDDRLTTSRKSSCLGKAALKVPPRRIAKLSGRWKRQQHIPSRLPSLRLTKAKNTLSQHHDQALEKRRETASRRARSSLAGNSRSKRRESRCRYSSPWRHLHKGPREEKGGGQKEAQVAQAPSFSASIWS